MLTLVVISATQGSAEMMKRIQKQAKTIRAQLKLIVNSGDSSHQQLEERRPEVFEIIEGIGVLLKIRMKDKTPPCVLKFSRSKKLDIFKVYYSFDAREPTEQNNQGHELNVSHYAFLKKMWKATSDFSPSSPFAFAVAN